MAEHRQAVVVGALGVIGRYIVERLLADGGWSVIGLSRVFDALRQCSSG